MSIEGKDLTQVELDAEIDAEMAERARLEAEAVAEDNARIFLLTDGLTAVLSQLEASNREALAAAYTLAYRLTVTAIKLSPSSAPDLREMALRLLLNTADPRPVDANIQIPGTLQVEEGELREITPTEPTQ